MAQLGLFLNPALAAQVMEGSDLVGLSTEVWLLQVRPLAVGTVFVAALHTLYRLRTSLLQGIGQALGDLKTGGADDDCHRLNVDLDFRKTGAAIAMLAVPLCGLYWFFSQSLAGAVLLTVVIIIIGVLEVVGVVCCAAAIAGDMLQDLKVSHILGGTPWKVEAGELIGVTVASVVWGFPMIAMDRVYEIGSAELPAPQAGLMSLMSQGIVGGEMAWPLVIGSVFLAIGLILINAPSLM